MVLGLLSRSIRALSLAPPAQAAPVFTPMHISGQPEPELGTSLGPGGRAVPWEK